MGSRMSHRTLIPDYCCEHQQQELVVSHDGSVPRLCKPLPFGRVSCPGSLRKPFL